MLQLQMHKYNQLPPLPCRLFTPFRVTQKSLGNDLIFHERKHDATFIACTQSLLLMFLWETLLQHFLLWCYCNGSSLWHVLKNSPRRKIECVCTFKNAWYSYEDEIISIAKVCLHEKIISQLHNFVINQDVENVFI